MRLLRNTRERYLSRLQPRLAGLRHVQAVTAMRQAVLLQPKLAHAHYNLALLYGDLHWADLMLTHQKEYLRLLKEMGPAPGETTTQFANRVVSLEAEAKLLEEQIKGIEENLLGKVATMKVVNRAREARKVGLGGLALQLLLDSDVATYGPAGLELEYELLLFAGRAQELKAWSEPEHISKIGPSTYYWYQTLLDAALGDYAQANADLFALFPAPRGSEKRKRPSPTVT